MEKVAIIGFGCAGYHGAKALRSRDSQASIDVYTDVSHPPANPMLTTYYVKKAIPRDALFPFGSLESIADDYRLNIRQEKVIGLEGATRTLQLEGGEHPSYDRILIATGASAFAPPIEGINLPGVLVMRTPADAQQLKELLEEKRPQSALVIGASMTGIKVAELLHLGGVECTMVDGAPYMFPLAAFEETAHRIQERLQQTGIHLAFEELLCGISLEEDRVWAEMKSGARYGADVIVICIGTRANVGFLEGSGVAVNRGIPVDEGMQTNLSGIYAAGDCCEAYELQSGSQAIVGLWANAASQGRVAGENMAGASSVFNWNIFQNISHFLEMDFIGMGNPALVQPGDDLLEYEKDDFYLRAVKGTEGIRCINLLGRAQESGIIKNRFMKSLLGGEGLDVAACCALKNAGFPDEFIAFMGGLA